VTMHPKERTRLFFIDSRMPIAVVSNSEYPSKTMAITCAYAHMCTGAVNHAQPSHRSKDPDLDTFANMMQILQDCQ
jgi:hypothetical protein